MWLSLFCCVYTHSSLYIKLLQSINSSSGTLSHTHKRWNMAAAVGVNGVKVVGTTSSQAYLEGKAVKETRALMAELCRHFYSLGWVSGTGGSLSIKVHDDSIPKPHQLILMAPSGIPLLLLLFPLLNWGEGGIYNRLIGESTLEHGHVFFLSQVNSWIFNRCPLVNWFSSINF